MENVIYGLNIEFIDKSYMWPVAVYLNNWPLEDTCKEYDVIRRVHLNRGDGLVHIRISEVLQVITKLTINEMPGAHSVGKCTV